MITGRPTKVSNLPLSVSSVQTAPSCDGVCCAVIGVEQEEDVRVDGGVGHDGHSYDRFEDPTPGLVAPRGTTKAL